MRTRLFKSSGNPVRGVPEAASNTLKESGHRSVLLHEAIEILRLQEDDIVVDATLGGAGHAREIVKHLGKRGTFIGIDADADAIERSKALLRDVAPAIHIAPANFRTITRILEAAHIPHISKVLFDLGWSSFQLESGRGFSFLNDEPLSLAYDKDQKLTAGVIVNEWNEESIADILWGWGDERYSRRIARGIIEARDRAPILTARELGELIRASVPIAYRRGKSHPANKNF